MKTEHLNSFITSASALALIVTTVTANAQRMKTNVPDSITTPDSVKTRIGTLKFFYGHLDFNRATESFMAGMPAASVQALCEGVRQAGFAPNQGIQPLLGGPQS